MTVHNPPTTDRTAFVRWLCLFGLAILFMFLGSLWLFSLLPGVDANALYAPITTHLWGNLGGILIVGAGTIAFVVAWKGIAPAVRAYYDPATRRDRADLSRILAERDAAREAASLAETDLQNALGHVAAWHRIISDDYRTLFPNDPGTPAPDIMLRTMRTELLITRPAVERLDTIVRERDDLRTRMTDLLNQPTPAPIHWADLLPLVQHIAACGVKVGGLRDAIRKVTPIPEGEYDRFSAAVRALPAYSPTKKGVKPSSPPPVNASPVTPSALTDGRIPMLTDAKVHGRTARTQRTRPKPHAARVRAGTEVEA
jgi:hypothetical protein